MEERKKHVLVVDDDDRLLDLLQKFLFDNDFIVSIANNSSVALDILDLLKFDVIVLDVMMPGENGFVLTKRIREKSQVPILILSAMGEITDRITGLQEGADDYLTKPFDPKELLLRINNILKRVEPIGKSRQQLMFGVFSYDMERKELFKGEEKVKLSPAESQLLDILARNPSKMIEREEIARQIGNDNLRTVDVQITRLRKKIEDNSKNPRYLQTMRGKGYALFPD